MWVLYYPPVTSVYLQSLTYLDVSYNNLTGNVSIKDSVVFDYVWQKHKTFQSLKELFISHNKIKSLGPIIQEGKNYFEKLSSLDASNNDLSGELPAYLGTKLMKA